MKQEFEMKRQEMDDILQINKDQMPVMLIGGITTGMDLAEKINRYWKGLGEKYGFDYKTVGPSAKGELFFLAVPKKFPPPKTKEEKEMDKYDSLFKIIDALETANFENQAGFLKNFIPFMALKRMATK